jgi:hypothetical protein
MRPASVFTGLVNAINVGEVGGVPLNRGDTAFDCSDRLVQLGLATAGDENPCALCGEALGGPQADARAAASYDCYFVFKFPVHKRFCFVCGFQHLVSLLSSIYYGFPTITVLLLGCWLSPETERTPSGALAF